MKHTLFSFITLALVACFIAGCGGDKRPDGMPKLYPASIGITQEGEPLAGATVQLIPGDGVDSRWGPMGMTDAAGVVVLKTNARYNGAPLGTYRVTVSKVELEPHPHPEWSSLPDGDPNFQKYQKILETLKPIDYVGQKYGSVTDSPLKVEITAGGKTYPLDLEKPTGKK